MIGTAYRALIDGERAALIDLSLSGAQVHAAAFELRIRPAGHDQDWLVARGAMRGTGPCSMVRLARGHPGGFYRAGLAFEASDVRGFKEIVSRVGT
jgi:hypothetical protein